ncbi:unnamed protein product [Peniophora sp. CBMAI 1063]|nr:unnamed protein product [Peniophora sp. CBMAI 1063]
MTSEPSSTSQLPDVLSLASPTLMGLPNELLIKIVEFLGPPDLSCCDPGWLVIPAVCHRLCGVVSKISSWESGTVAGPDNAQAAYGWSTFSFGERRGLPPGTPDIGFWMRDTEDCVSLSCSPVYKGGRVEFPCASLSITAWDDDTQQTVDRYLGGPTLLSEPRLNFEPATPRNFSFSNAPRIVAPALEELTLESYVADWRCGSLKKLTIKLRRSQGYRYPPAELLARLRESRLTLEQVRLDYCFPSVPEDDEDARHVPIEVYPRLKDFKVRDDPHEANWLCKRIGLPSRLSPIITGSQTAGITYLRSLACEYGKSVPDPKPGRADFHGELDTLTFRPPNEFDRYGCFITASKITGVINGPWLHEIEDHSLDVYARICTARYMDCDYDQDVRELDGKVPGIEPVFVTRLDWTRTAWDLPPGMNSACGAQCSALHGIKHVFIDGTKGRLLGRGGNWNTTVWISILRHLPNVRSLYIYNPCPAYLELLTNEPDILPNLRKLWLGRDEHSKGDDDWRGFIPAMGHYDSDADDLDSDSDSDSDGGDSDGDDRQASERESQANEQDVASERIGDPKNEQSSPAKAGSSHRNVASQKDRVLPSWKCEVDAGLLMSVFRSRTLNSCALENVEVVGDAQEREELQYIFGGAL